jgi:UDP-2,4-diacetamido-2,4,6-trideoxy-beta-L-altropyranose hydrolase
MRGFMNERSMNLLFRTDASVAIGTGHVMRCLALAQAWQDAGGRALFALAESTPAIRARLAEERCEMVSVAVAAGTAAAGTEEDASQTIETARKQNCSWIVVDGYCFGADYQRALKAAGMKVLFLDDYGHAQHYSADLVLNQNLGADASLYASRELYTQVLLGPRYCLLRREFAAWRDWKREIPQAGRRVLVTMGGSDPENLTARVMQALALAGTDNLEATVVVGGSSPHSDSLEAADAQRGKTIRVRRDVKNIAELMAWADVAVSSAGTTCWELCLLGLPGLLVDVAENQKSLAQELSRRQCAIHVGGPRDFTAAQLAVRLANLLASHETRQAMSLRCHHLVDGKGASRILTIMRAGLRLRRAREDDSRLLWEWANDPAVRAAAFSTAPIPWEQHKVWFAGKMFAGKMNDRSCDILIAENDAGRGVGQFRVDWRSALEGEIDVSVTAEFRGTGYGAVLIELGVGNILAERGERLHAFVKTENQPSQSAFERAGFISAGEETRHGQRAIHYVCTKTNAGARSE